VRVSTYNSTGGLNHLALVIDGDDVRIARKRERLIAADSSGPEVAALDADIDVVADRIIDARNRLPGEFACALISKMDASIAGADTKISANSGLATEIQEAIHHGRPGMHAVV